MNHTSKPVSFTYSDLLTCAACVVIAKHSGNLDMLAEARADYESMYLHVNGTESVGGIAGAVNTVRFHFGLSYPNSIDSKTIEADTLAAARKLAPSIIG